MTAIQTFPTWKTVKIGTGHKAIKDFCKSEIGLTVQILKSLKVSTIEKEVRLVRVTISDLGLPDPRGAHNSEVVKAAKSFGLRTCPLEVGPQLMLQYTDQPVGETIIVGMSSVLVTGTRYKQRCVLTVTAAEKGRYLSCHSSIDDTWGLDVYWRPNWEGIFIQDK